MSGTSTPVLDRLATTHFPHLPLREGREAVIRMMDDLNRECWKDARFEQHHVLRLTGQQA